MVNYELRNKVETLHFLMDDDDDDDDDGLSLFTLDTTR